MLKISEGKHADRMVRLRLDGNLVGAWVGELEQVCDSFMALGRKVTLDLVGVGYLDSTGVNLLTRLQGRGVLLAGCSTFVQAQLRACRNPD